MPLGVCTCYTPVGRWLLLLAAVKQMRPRLSRRRTAPTPLARPLEGKIALTFFAATFSRLSPRRRPRLLRGSLHDSTPLPSCLRSPFFISTAFNVFGKFSKVPTARGEASKREMSPKHLRIESVLSRRDVEKWRQRIMRMRCRDFSIERS